MKKSKDQIVRHVANCKFPEDEWNLVLNYCKINYGSGIHKAIIPKSKSTFAQFKEWVERGFASGDIVSIGNSVGIIADQTPEATFISALLDENGVLTQDEIIVPLEKVKLAKKKEKKRLEDALDAELLVFNVRLSKLMKKKQARSFSRVEFEYEGRTIYGITGEISNNIIPFVAIVDDKGGDVKTNIEIPIEKITFKDIRKKGVDKLSQSLSANGLRWNHESNVLEPIPRRATKGSTYWYINDRFKVVSGKEDGKPATDARYACGNYFVDFQKAFDLLIKINEIINEKKKGD